MESASDVWQFSDAFDGLLSELTREVALGIPRTQKKLSLLNQAEYGHTELEKERIIDLIKDGKLFLDSSK